MKLQQSVLIEADNLIEDIFIPIVERPKYSEISLPVFFYRYIGMDNEKEYFEEITFIDKKLSLFNRLYKRFIGEVPFILDKELVTGINSIWNSVTIEDIRTERIGEILSDENLLHISEDMNINNRIKKELPILIKKYVVKENITNMNKIKTFILKQLIWTKAYIIPLFSENSKRYNPKILYYGDINIYEVYFLILLSKIGCDVLFINSLSEDEYLKVDSKSEFSLLIKGSRKVQIPPFPGKREIAPVVVAEPKKASDLISIEVIETFNNKATVQLIEAPNVLEDVFTSLHKRKGYLGLPRKPILPIYFYRIIGIEDVLEEGIDIYYNKLFFLEERLKRECNYIKFENNIPINFDSAVINLTKNIWNGYETFENGEINSLINKIYNLKILPKGNEAIFDETMKNAFKEIIYLYLENEKNPSLNKVKTFILKIITWVRAYFDDLYRKEPFRINSKILYYGDIKEHEVYLLLYFSKLGSDVLFISPNKENDNNFKQIKGIDNFTRKQENEHSSEVRMFPTTEKLVRRSTVAYKASKEIQELIYGNDVGVFKPWQLEAFKVSPITLKTTYDELKILWKEPSIVRPEFKTVNDIVYMPNLFAKVKGTTEDLSVYWEEVREFINPKNTHFIKGVPFTTIDYSKRELSEIAYLFNTDGSLDKERLRSSRFYNFSHLKTSLQDLIFNKVLEVISSDVFKIKIDKEFRIKVVMTILKLDIEILKLIENFDFGGDIPKLIVMDNNRELFSEEDAITICFLNLIGIDILILTPTNYNNIEDIIKEKEFDIHQLPKTTLDLDISNLDLLIETGCRSVGEKKFWNMIKFFTG